MSAPVIKRVEFHPDILAVLDELQEWLGLDDHPAVLQKAVQILAVIKDHGDCFYVPAPDGGMHMVMFDEFTTPTAAT